MPLKNTPFEPGRCLDYINEMEAGPIKEIALAEYHYFSGQPEKAALEMRADRYPIPAIYLHLAAVMDYMSLKQTQQAQKHLLAAWEIARPDDLIEGFGEHHGLLGGMLEAVIKPDWPEDFRRLTQYGAFDSKAWQRP